MTPDIQKKIPKRSLLLILLISVYCAFNYTIFTPLSMFMQNVHEFPFMLKDFIVPALLMFVVSCIILFVILRFLPQKASLWVGAFLIGITTATYIQGNFINLDYGILDGKAIAWNKMFIPGIVNSIIWLVIIAIPFVLVSLMKKHKMTNLFARVLIILLGCQLLTLFMQYAKLKYPPSSSKREILSDKDIFDLSSKENFIVFIIDTLDTELMNKYLKEYPNSKKYFAGFTYLRNTIGMYPTTRGALPHLLTGVKNTNEHSVYNYITYAYENSDFLKKLKNKKFNIYYYTTSIFASFKKLGLISNIGILEKVKHAGFAFYFAVYRPTIFRYSPHFAKKYAFKIQSFGISQFTHYNEPGECDQYFLDLYKNKRKLTATQDTKAFKLYHLRGVHHPYYNTRQLHANFKRLQRYMDEMKKHNIYDSSNIVILADHGTRNCGQKVTLLIKPRYAKAPFKINDSPFSYDKLHDMFLYLTDQNHISQELFTAQRKYLYYKWDDKWDNNWDMAFLPKINEFVFTEADSDFPSNYIFKNKNIDFKKQRPRHSFVGKYKNGELHTSGKEGYLIFGQYYTMPKGKYILKIRGRSWSTDTAKVDICSNWGKTKHEQYVIKNSNAKTMLIVDKEFLLTQNTDEVEFRIHVGKNDKIALQGFSLKRLGDYK